MPPRFSSKSQQFEEIPVAPSNHVNSVSEKLSVGHSAILMLVANYKLSRSVGRGLEKWYLHTTLQKP